MHSTRVVRTSRDLIALVFLTFIGSIFRLQSFRYNIYLHGDINVDCAVAESIANNGNMIVPFPGPHYYPISKFGFGYPLDQHAPLWPIIGAIVYLVTKDCFAALKIISLISGVLLIPASFVVFRKLFNVDAARLAAVCVTFSYLMIDFSGNGSLYMLEALLFLLFAFFASAPAKVIDWAVLGFIAGISYLLNYQTIVILLALIIAYFATLRREAFCKEHYRKLLLAFLVALLVVSPWFLRNYFIFGTPLFNVNLNYVYGKLGIPQHIKTIGDNIVVEWLWDEVSYLTILKTFLAWTGHNFYYMARKLFVLTPLIFVFSILGFFKLLNHTLKKRKRDCWGFIPLLLFYSSICAVWPIVKFRYFVPLLPLILGLGGYYISQLESAKYKLYSSLACVFGVIFFSALTFLSIPSRTYYYDGAITTDPFGVRGEALFIEELQPLMDAAAFVKTQGNAPILVWDIAVHYVTHSPVVRGAPVEKLELNSLLIDKYKVKYVLIAKERLPTRDRFPGFRKIYENKKYMVLGLK